MYSPDTLFDGRYLLKQQLGRGSFGEVWLATDQQVGVDFAIKIYVAMNTQGLEQFRTEYQLSCNLINSNLLHVNHMGICQQDSCPYLVMPYCPRGTSSMIGQVDETTLWKFIHDVASGLSYLHAQNPPIVHQDIKPDNILQTQNGDFVISDFGISKQMRATCVSTINNSSGAIAYMGPERFESDYQTIKASDIWSLGATIYELATGQLPFEGRGGAMLNSGASIPNLPSQFSSDINNVMRSCLDKDTWNRPSAMSLVETADQFLKQPTSTTINQPQDPQSKAEPVKNTSKSGKSIKFLLLTIVAGLIGYFAYDYYMSQNKHSAQVNPSAVTSKDTPVQNEDPVINKEPSAAPTPTANDVVNTEDPIEVPEAVQKVTKPVKPTVRNGNLKLSYAIWTGGILEGKPHGKGVLSFTQHYDLQGHDIEIGDRVEGECENGKLTGYCKWIRSDGTEKSILLGE